MDLSEKLGYLKGLISGLDIDENSKEGKVFAAVTDVLDEMANCIYELDDSVCELEELTDVIDEDLGSLEEDFYDDDEDYDDEDYDEDEEYDEDDDDCYYEVVCPTCGDTVCINEAMLEEGQIDCPGCGELLEFDLEDDESEEKGE